MQERPVTHSTAFRTTPFDSLIVPHPVTPGRSSLQPPWHNSPSVPGPSNAPNVSTTPTPVNRQSTPPGPHQTYDGADSDADARPRLSAAEKGKRPVTAVSYISASEMDEPMGEEDEERRWSATPTPHAAQVMAFFNRWNPFPDSVTHPQDRPATVNDLLNLGESIRRGQMEAANRILEGLRPGVRSHFQDAGDDGDIEGEAFEQKIPRSGTQKRRSHWENLLSVSILLPIKLL